MGSAGRRRGFLAGFQQSRNISPIPSSKPNEESAFGPDSMTTTWQDLVYGFRMLLKKPGFTIVAALSLALGIGANATIFSIINATLLSDLVYPSADRLMVLWTAPLNRPGIRNYVTAGNYLAWKDRSQSFESMGGMFEFPSNLGAERDGSPAERL